MGVLPFGTGNDLARVLGVLCQTVKDFVAKVGEAHEKEGQKDSDIALKVRGKQCNVLNEKLESLLVTLNDEAEASTPSQAIFKPRDALMSRANSLKKAIRQIIEHTERAVDEQNAQTEEQYQRMKESPLYKADSSELLDSSETSPQRGLAAHAETSRSAPTFSIFTLEAAPKTPISSPRNLVHTDPNLSVKDLETGASRRISSMSMLNKTASVGSVLGRDKSPQKELTAPLFGVPFHTILPGLNSNIAGKLAGGSFISKVLLANADALCAAASPLVEDDIPPSRTKNFMWYGVLGGKELVQRSFKNLDQRVQLECDGQRIPLPSLQGIVILNIPRYINQTHISSTYHLAKFI
uniref:Diacylglycerol kinase delta n=1 Tax=Magallana gigas TaxID=29159 RepID=K1Q6W8_MAGGI